MRELVAPLACAHGVAGGDGAGGVHGVGVLLTFDHKDAIAGGEQLGQGRACV